MTSMPNMWIETWEISLQLVQQVMHRKVSSTSYPLETQKAFV